MGAVIDLSTAGTRLGLAFETTGGVRPTSNYINIPGPKSIPAADDAPSMLETTSLNATKYRTYIPGLRDIAGGDIAVTFNYTQAFCDTWDDLYETNETNKASGKRAWLEIYTPGIDDAFYIPVDIISRGNPGYEVDSVLETTAHFTPIGEPVFDDAVYPTDAASA